MVKEIILSHGKTVSVDDEDFEWLSSYHWLVDANGYVVRSIRRAGNLPRPRSRGWHWTKKPGPNKGRWEKTIYMHQQVLWYPDYEIDHRDRNKLNNTKTNLRCCTSSQNKANQGIPRHNTSGYKGVFWHKTARKWQASIQVRKKSIYLGLYLTKKEAAMVYNKAAIKYFREFACLNILTPETAPTTDPG